jgi:antitoxin MazE
MNAAKANGAPVRDIPTSQLSNSKFGDNNVITMRARLIAIGNSRGVRLPKPLIEEAGLGDEIEIRVSDGAIIIKSAVAPRTGWEDAAARAHERGADTLPDDSGPTRFDEEEWDW